MVEVKIDMVQEGSFGNLKNWYGAGRICLILYTLYPITNSQQDKPKHTTHYSNYWLIYKYFVRWIFSTLLSHSKIWVKPVLARKMDLENYWGVSSSSFLLGGRFVLQLFLPNFSLLFPISVAQSLVF